MLGKRAEDYLEAIYELCKEKSFTRVKDIAASLNVKPPTVSEMLEKLYKEGYIIYRKRLFVSLTDKGKEVAKMIRERRETLVKFLKTLGVSEDIAEIDACTIEHVLHVETVNQLKKFVKFIEDSPINPRWLEHFRRYCETGEHPCKVLRIKGYKQKNLNVRKV